MASLNCCPPRRPSKTRYIATYKAKVREAVNRRFRSSQGDIRWLHLNKKDIRKHIKRIADKIISFSYRAGVILDPKDEPPQVEDSTTSTSGTANSHTKRKKDRLGRNRNLAAAKVVAGLSLDGEEDPNPMSLAEAVASLFGTSTLHAIGQVVRQLEQTGGHAIGIRRLELVARARVQSGAVDSASLIAQILAVDEALAAQELDGVPELEYKRPRPRREQEKKRRRR